MARMINRRHSDVGPGIRDSRFVHEQNDESHSPAVQRSNSQDARISRNQLEDDSIQTYYPDIEEGRESNRGTHEQSSVGDDQIVRPQPYQHEAENSLYLAMFQRINYRNGASEWFDFEEAKNVPVANDFHNFGYFEPFMRDEEVNYVEDLICFDNVPQPEVQRVNHKDTVKLDYKQLKAGVIATCSICYDHIMSKDNLRCSQHGCCSLFHSKCILQWIGVRNVCPNCNGNIDRHRLYPDRNYSNIIEHIDQLKAKEEQEIQKKFICKQHGQLSDYRCAKCEQLVCMECITTNQHAKCKIERVSEDFVKHKCNIEDYKLKLNDCAEFYSERMNEWKKIEEYTSEMFEKKLEKVKKELIAEIEVKANTIMRTFNELQESHFYFRRKLSDLQKAHKEVAQIDTDCLTAANMRLVKTTSQFLAESARIHELMAYCYDNKDSAQADPPYVEPYLFPLYNSLPEPDPYIRNTLRLLISGFDIF